MSTRTGTPSPPRPVTPSSRPATPQGRTATPIPAPIPQPVRTPAAAEFGAPSEGQRAYYGPAYPNLMPTGGLKVHPSWRDMTGRNFNCFAWSVGFTDRWIEGRTVAEMNRVYRKYFMHECTKGEAEVDLYRVLDAPADRQIGNRTLTNKRAFVMHAARRDNKTMDAAPNLGCSSKMADQHLILHNRAGVEDGRGHAARPMVNYGSIYQYWKRDPARHPSFPGNEGNPYPPQGHFPDHRIFEQGTGDYPPGHPGNSLGTPGLALGSRPASPAGGRQATALPTRTAPGVAGATRVVSSGSVTSNASNPGSLHSRTASRSSISSVSSGGADPLPPFKAESGKAYAKVLQMLPYAKIPPPSVSAVNAAKAAAKSLAAGKDAALVKDFDAKWAKWAAQWFANHTSNGPAESVDTPEFQALAKLGPKTMPLVVCKLASAANFPGVYLYNQIEASKDFRVAPNDHLNFCVLQRQANLIVEMNLERFTPSTAAPRN